MKKIYFVRHGQSQANLDDVGAGSEFDTPLTKKGKEQARATALELKDKGIELIVSSSLSRAVNTAEIIAGVIDYNPKNIIKNDSFIERGWGIYSKRPNYIYVKDALSDNLHESVEPVQEMHDRVVAGLEWLKSQKAQTILVVSHGGVSRILRLLHQELPHSHMYKLDRMVNASIYEFDL